jgi:hypothetical protein
LNETQAKKLIEDTVDLTFQKMNSLTIIERMKVLRNETFKNTEKLLYNYKSLKEHVADEDGYFGMLGKKKSGSIVRYSKSKASFNDDEMIRLRDESLQRSKNDLVRLEKAIVKVSKRKEYKVIELRYFTKKDNGETYTFEEIAEQLSQSGDYNETLSEKTVRRWRCSIVQEIAVFIFGSDAI